MSLQYKWQSPKQVDKSSVKELAGKLGVADFIARLLIVRNYDTVDKAKAFLHPELQNLDDPFKIHDMKKGTERIKKAIRDNEKITIYGDYDADGITSVSIMYSLLKHFHANVQYFLPNRFRDGYGPNLDEYKRIIANGTKLLITTDNGISGLHEIAYARKHGMDVIITDHHDFPKELPPANAIIMSKFPGHEYHHGREDFCGAGVAFKIAQAMLGRVPTEYLDLATLGTIADSVSLTNENRIIVANGLKHIQQSKRTGIQALAGMADVELSKLSSTDLSFSLIPRLNAIGRMDDPNCAVELLTTDSSGTALSIAQTIEGFNRERKQVSAQEVKEALQQAESPENKNRQTLVLWSKDWFPGIVGIIAGRIKEKLYKPVIVCGHLKSDPKGVYRGSGRSIDEFNLFTAMDPLRKYMVSFGGHPMACGLTIKESQLENLRNGLEKAGQKEDLKSVVPTVKTDLSLQISDINSKTMNALQALEPFGVDNEAPVIDLRLPQIFNVNQMGKNGSSMRFTLGTSKYSTHVVAFGVGNEAPALANDPFDIELSGSLNNNYYHHHTYLQFVVQHLRHYQRVPSKHELGVLYRKLYTAKALTYENLQRDLLIPIAQYLNSDYSTIKVAFQIFSELHLIKDDRADKTIKVNMHPQPCKLKDSETYNKILP